ncbi:restriction endonuclease subunit S [Flavobacterium restrictum]|uniref:Restriction endonuclease subunit S n=2 Tax=Flavobacterium restrictum TaxID=2594428 RepID=A0A553E701_9FLAO|nr:restriction endonuclease subunit S [Flavobacterium restrictum]
MCRRIFSDETSSIGDIPFFKIGSFGKEADAFISKELYLDYRKRFSYPKKGDVLISAAGTVGRTVVFTGEDAYFQDSNIVWIDNDNANVNNDFLFYILKIVKYNTEGGTIQRLYNSILKSTKFNSPKISEQNKIYNFLNLIDDRIQTQNKIIEELKILKSTLAQKLFSQQLRFKGDDGNDFGVWEVKKLGECLDYIQPTKYLVSSTEYDNSYKTPVLTAGKTFILGYTNETNGIFENNLPVIIFDDFTTATQFVDFPFKAKSSAMKILTATKGVYIKFIFEAMQFMNYEIGGHERHWISKFAPIEILVPSIDEQTRIADFLSSIDEKIKTENEILEQYKNQKQYLLYNLFI